MISTLLLCTTVLTDLHLEVVEGVLVDILHLLPESHGVVSKRQNV